MPQLACLSTTLPYHQHIGARGCEIQPWRWINSLTGSNWKSCLRRSIKSWVGPASDNLGCDFTHTGLNMWCACKGSRLVFKTTPCWIAGTAWSSSGRSHQSTKRCRHTKGFTSCRRISAVMFTCVPSGQYDHGNSLSKQAGPDTTPNTFYNTKKCSVLFCQDHYVDIKSGIGITTKKRMTKFDPALSLMQQSIKNRTTFIYRRVTRQVGRARVQ